MGAPSEGRGAAARAKALRLLEYADRCDKGDDGERNTARLLLDLPDPWVDLHRVVLPGRRFDIDHLLIGPGGVIALDSKNYSGRVQVKNGTLWSGRYPKAYELAAAREHAEAASAVLGVDVIAALCIHKAELPADHFVVDGLDVLAPRQLVAWLRQLPPMLLDMQVVAIAAAARRHMEIHGIPGPAVTSANEPAPPRLAWPPVYGGVPPQPPPSGGSPRSPAPSRGPRRARSSGGARKKSALSRRIEKLVVEGLTGLAVLGLASWYVPRMAQSIGKSATTSTTAAPTQTSASPPALDSGAFSCPTRGSGWTLRLPWPSGQAHTAAFQAQWSTSPEGPWSAPLPWTGGSQLSISALQGGTRVFVRAQAAATAPNGPSSMAMQKVPTQAC